jgi:hypothetical protein
MKKIILFFIWMCSVGLAICQNVGIGTAIPAEKLTIGSGNLLLENSTKGIMLNGADNAMITRGFDAFTSGKHTGLGRWGLYMEPNVLTVGIPNVFGKRMAVSALDANSTVAKEILVVSQSGNVGINVSDPQWMLDVNGGMQLKGRLFVSGSSGTAGQVLTSNFLSPPSWQTLAVPYDNAIRFAASFSQGATSNSGCIFSTTPRYNLSPANISFGTDGITLTQAGLYHFDVFVRARYAFASAPAFAPVFSFELTNGLANSFPFVSDVVMPTSGINGTSTVFLFTDKFSVDIHVAAGAQVRLTHGFGLGGGNSYQVSGYLAGYLINE